MGNVLCYAAVHEGKIKRSSLEVLSHFREQAILHGDVVEAMVVHPGPEQFLDVLARHGAARVYTVAHPVFDGHANEPLLSAVEFVVRESRPSIVACASTEGVKDILGALGFRVGASVLSDVSTAVVHDGFIEVTRPVLAAKRMARVRSVGEPVLVSVRSGSYAATESPVDAEAVRIPFEFDEASMRIQVRDVLRAAGGAVDLGEAAAVVAAGRGVKDDEGRRLVEELASLLGAAVGATRALTESGVYPATAQIGQTGKVVSPELYFAVGISGAIQHVAGMSNSRVIVAINKDPDAPIFKYCTYGIVGDLYRVLPKLIEQLRAAGLG